MPEQHRVRVFDARKRCPILPIVEGEGTAWAVVWPGTGAKSRSLHRISLSRRARTVELSHPMEAVYYVIEGTAVAVDPKDNSRQELVEGSMVHIGSGTSYVFIAGDGGVEIVGGPCPPDPEMYKHLEGQ